MDGSEVGQGRLGRIGLALSGGGYRAAAFHLGTMRALEDLGLFADVRYLSTASGGSLLAARWISSVVAGDEFAKFEQDTRVLLERNLVAESLDRLHEGRRRASLVQRAAEVYAGFLSTAGADGSPEPLRLGPLSEDARVRARVDHVVINATHFSLGYGFRFTFPPRPRAPFGNKTVRMEPPEAWRDVRLADAVAASACFPAGFEPLLFPDDFTWTDERPRVTANVPDSDATERCVPLMDGGIYDNQATDSLLLIDRALERRNGDADDGAADDAGDELGLVLVSDTDQKQMPFYEPPEHRRGLGSLPVGAWVGLATLLCFGCVAGALAAEGWRASLCTIGATLLALPVLSLGALLVVADGQLPFAYEGLTRQVLRFPVNELARFIAERLGSVLSLTTKVFMFRVRALQYEVASLRLGNRLLAVRVYDTETKAALGASPAIRACAERARAVPTALWMTPAQREDVIATGYATTLAVLSRYLQRWKAQGDEFRRGVPFPAALAERVEQRWSAVRDAPQWPAGR